MPTTPGWSAALDWEAGIARLQESSLPTLVHTVLTKETPAIVSESVLQDSLAYCLHVRFSRNSKDYGPGGVGAAGSFPIRPRQPGL